MRNKLNFYACLFFIIILGSVIESCQTNRYTKSNLHRLKNSYNNLGNLKAFYFEPSNPVKNAPLLVVLHGCSQNALQAAELTGWNELAEKNGFYVLYPEQKRFNNPTKCFNWYNKYDNVKNKGECFSIVEFARKMTQNHLIDTSKIFVTGMSAGGAMSTVLASTYPEYFAGVAVFAGVPYYGPNNVFESARLYKNQTKYSPQELGDLVRNQNPGYTGTYPRMMIFHGKNDLIVDFEKSNLLASQWSNVLNLDFNSCSEHIINTDIKEINFCNDSNDILIKKIEIDNLGHQLLVDPGIEENQGGKVGVYGKDKNYFSSYWVMKFFNLDN